MQFGWNILPDFDFTTKKNYSKEDIFKTKNFSDFAKDHIRCNQYSLTEKCMDVNCKFHRAICTEREIFEQIKWLPTIH